MNSEPRPDGTWLPVVRAAEILGSTPLNVLLHLKRGLLVGVERDDGWLVDPGPLAELRRQQRENATPAVCQSVCAKKSGGCGGCA